MPTYTFRNKDTGETHDSFMSIAAREAFLAENPDYETVMMPPGIIAGVDNSSGGRLPSGFKDVLKRMKDKHPLSSGLNHLT